MAALLRRVASMLVVGLTLAGLTANVRAQGPIADYVPETVAETYGLTSAWLTVLSIDAGRDRIENLVLIDGLLLMQSHTGIIQALDAETGRSLWVTRVGNPLHVTVAPTANDKFVVVANGSTLYFLHRADGTLHAEQRLGGAPSTGLAITSTRVYVPLTTGAVEAYNLDRSTAISRVAMIFYAAGAATATPLVTDNHIMWGTTEDFVYIHDLVLNRNRIRFKAGDAVVGPLDYKKPLVYAASKDGWARGLDEATGEPTWQYYVGSAVRNPPIVSGDAVYVLPDLGGIVRLNAATGEPLWTAPGPSQFISASPTRVYAADAVGRMFILDAASGARLAVLPAERMTLKMMNRQNDRLYVGTDTGVLQCLHERALQVPAVRGMSDAASSEAVPAGTTPAAGAVPSTGSTPAASTPPTGQAPATTTPPPSAPSVFDALPK